MYGLKQSPFLAIKKSRKTINLQGEFFPDVVPNAQMPNAMSNLILARSFTVASYQIYVEKNIFIICICGHLSENYIIS